MIKNWEQYKNNYIKNYTKYFINKKQIMHKRNTKEPTNLLSFSMLKSKFSHQKMIYLLQI